MFDDSDFEGLTEALDDADEDFQADFGEFGRNIDTAMLEECFDEDIDAEPAKDTPCSTSVLDSGEDSENLKNDEDSCDEESSEEDTKQETEDEQETAEPCTIDEPIANQQDGVDEPPVKRKRLRKKTTQPPGFPCPRPVHAEGPSEIVFKKPARAKYPNELCPGAHGSPCRLSTSQEGHKRLIQPNRGQKTCVFHGKEEFDKAVAHHSGFEITKALKTLKQWPDQRFYEEALEQIETLSNQILKDQFRAKVEAASKKAEKKAKTKPENQGIADQWRTLLEKRQCWQKVHNKKQKQQKYDDEVRFRV